MTRWLWQGVGDQNLEMERIINLLNCSSSHKDDSAILEVDEAFLQLTVS
ncbi:hypothetical protein [Synechococcus sp. UW179A]|nr:hypothetical protein [Synechococcus sp. UW179A]